MAVADAVDDVTGVRRTGGGGVEISTLFAGGRALGVRLTDNEVEVHVVAEDVDLLALSASVHDAVRRCLDTLGDDRPVLVAIDDIDIAGPGGGPS